MIVEGALPNRKTGCAHWQSARDIVALKCPCHQSFYACLTCHEEKEGKLPLLWPRDAWAVEKAILCRACDRAMTILDYMTANNICPFCAANFNPGCKNHWPLYFDMNAGEQEKKSGTV